MILGKFQYFVRCFDTFVGKEKLVQCTVECSGTFSVHSVHSHVVRSHKLNFIAKVIKTLHVETHKVNEFSCRNNLTFLSFVEKSELFVRENRFYFFTIY